MFFGGRIVVQTRPAGNWAWVYRLFLNGEGVRAFLVWLSARRGLARAAIVGPKGWSYSEKFTKHLRLTS